MIELFLLRLTDRYHSDVNLQVRLGSDSSDSFDCIIAWSYAIVHVHARVHTAQRLRRDSGISATIDRVWGRLLMFAAASIL